MLAANSQRVHGWSLRWMHDGYDGPMSVVRLHMAGLLYDGGTTGTTEGRYWRDIFVDLIRTNPTKHDAKPMTIWRQTTFM